MPLRMLQLLLAAVAALLPSCKVGPNYTVPEAPSEPTFRALDDASPAVDPAPPDLVDWWTRFNDPILNECISRAERQNQSLAAALANVQAAYASLGVTESQFWPQISMAAEYQRDRTNVSQLAAVGVETQPYNLWAYGAGMANWEIDIWGRVARQVESATASAESKLDTLRGVLISVRGQVGATYLQVRMLQAELALAEELVESLRKTRDLTVARVERGTASTFDLARVQTELDIEAATIPGLQGALDSAINSLAALCGEAPAAFAPVVSARAPIPPPPSAIAVGLPADLLRRRPDVMSAERTLAAAVSQIGANEALHLPILSLSGTIYIASNQFSGLGNVSGNLTYNAGPQISWLLFAGGYVNAMVATAKAQAQAALAQYRESVLTAMSDTESAIAHVIQSQRALALTRKAEASAKEALRLATLQYEAGLTDLTTLLDVVEKVITVSKELVQTEGLVGQDAVALYRALGGGWEKSAADVAGESAQEQDFGVGPVVPKAKEESN